jgi:hypothetical protein
MDTKPSLVITFVVLLQTAIIRHVKAAKNQYIMKYSRIGDTSNKKHRTITHKETYNATKQHQLEIGLKSSWLSPRCLFDVTST